MIHPETMKEIKQLQFEQEACMTNYFDFRIRGLLANDVKEISDCKKQENEWLDRITAVNSKIRKILYNYENN